MLYLKTGNIIMAIGSLDDVNHRDQVNFRAPRLFTLPRETMN